MVAPYQVFATRDGELMIAGGNDRLFRAHLRVLGLPELVDDPRFRDEPATVCGNRDELVALLEERLRDGGHRDVARAARPPRASRPRRSPTSATSPSRRRPRRSGSSSGSTTRASRA